MEILITLMRVLRVPAFFIFRQLLATILPAVPFMYSIDVTLTTSYDFIVVGGGGAGCVVAARLAEAGAEVLVLEAGGYAPPESAVPYMAPIMQGSNKDWDIRMASQLQSQWGFVNNASYLPLGKMMGGSGSMGGLVYARGNRFDYDNWAGLGNPGWDYRSVLPYFKKSENYVGTGNRRSNEYHGDAGPLSTDSKQFTTKVGQSFLEAGKELGYSIIDENGPASIGFSPLHFTIREGLRDSTSESYLKPLFSSERLTVLMHATVVKILFDERKRAIGVEYVLHGQTRSVRARKEVIVSAGAIHSPKLLMLSGIGPTNHLAANRIPIVSSVEGVGQNLQDHHAITNFAFTVDSGTAVNVLKSLNLNTLKEYAKKKSGPLSRPYGEDGSAWVHLGDGGDPRWPDVQISMFNSPFAFGSLAIGLTTGLRKEVYQDVLEPVQLAEAILMVPVLLRPKSRGWVLLKSENPMEQPIVDFNFLSHTDDVDLMIKAIQFSLTIAKTDAMKNKVGAQFPSKLLRFCSEYNTTSNLYWECYARHLVTSFYHPVGTCKMAPDSDELGVVSNVLKVRGVQKLRVVDASIMPTINSANTLAAVIMIAEKASDIIKRDWGYLT